MKVAFFHRRVIVAAAWVSLAGAGIGDARAGQSPAPPIHGVTGTVATEETIKDTRGAGRGVFGKVARLFGWGNRDAMRNPDDAATDEIFAGLMTGTAVAVQETTSGGNLTAVEVDRLRDEGAEQIDGVIAAVDRAERTVAVRLADGSRQRLRFLGRADAGNAGSNRIDSPRVIVVIKGGSSQPMVLFFTHDL